MCARKEEKYKEEMQEKKGKRMPLMSALTAFFSHAPCPALTGWVSEPKLYSPWIILVSDDALCICSGEDRTAAAINYSARTLMPQSLLGGLPACLWDFLPGFFQMHFFNRKY